MQEVQTVPRAEAEEPMQRRGFLRKVIGLAAGGAALGTLLGKKDAEAAAIDPYLGEIMLFAGNFAPTGWALCNGQLLSIAQFPTLFNILGTTYGGNGTTTFALPDLRGRAPIHQGQGPGLTNRIIGEKAGEESHTLTIQEMPAHTHTAGVRSGNGTSANPAGLVPARDPSGVPHYGSSIDAALAADAIGVAGASQPHNNMQPYLAISYCICVQGVDPSQP